MCSCFTSVTKGQRGSAESGREPQGRVLTAVRGHRAQRVAQSSAGCWTCDSSMNKPVVLLALLVLCGCRPAARSTSPAAMMTVIRTNSLVDSADLRAGRTKLTVVVRTVDEPSIALAHATVRVWRVGADSVQQARLETPADTFAVARFDALPAGNWRVEGSQIGYSRHRVAIRSNPGCHTVVELYLARSINCLFTCPTTPPRAVITTCVSDV
jgi:hypothetical protein